MPVQEEQATLVHKRSLVMRRITNLEKKISTLVSNEEVMDYDMVCAKQFLCDIQNLDQQFQSIHEKAGELVLDNPDAVEKDNEEVETYDDRVRENSSRLTYFMTSKQSSSAIDTDVNKNVHDEKTKKCVKRKWKQLDQDVTGTVIKVETVKDNREHLDKEELTELKTELSEHVKSLDQLTNEIENSISEPDTLQINDSGDNWMVTCGEMYNKLKSHQEMIMFLVGEHRGIS